MCWTQTPSLTTNRVALGPANFLPVFSSNFGLRREIFDMHGVARQGRRSSASRRHAVARQAVEIRAMSSVERAHGMTIKGQEFGSGGRREETLGALFFLGGL